MSEIKQNIGAEFVRGVTVEVARRHEGLTLHAVLKGSGQVQVGDRKHPLTKDGYLLVRSDLEQHVMLAAADYIRLEIPASLVGAQSFSEALTPHDYVVDVSIARLLAIPGHREAVDLLQALVAARDSSREQFFLGTRAPSMVQNARELLLARLAVPQDLGSIAAQSGYSPYHFHRLFSRFHGLSPLAYVTQERVRKACRELILHDAPFEEISQECGYLSPTSFAAVFKRATRFTPVQFRKQGLRFRESMSFYR